MFIEWQVTRESGSESWRRRPQGTVDAPLASAPLEARLRAGSSSEFGTCIVRRQLTTLSLLLVSLPPLLHTSAEEATYGIVIARSLVFAFHCCLSLFALVLHFHDEPCSYLCAFIEIAHIHLLPFRSFIPSYSRRIGSCSLSAIAGVAAFHFFISFLSVVPA